MASRQGGSEKGEVMDIDHENGKGSRRALRTPERLSPETASNNGEGGGDAFNFRENIFNGDEAKRSGIFGFGNKNEYFGSKIPKDDKSSEEESDSVMKTKTKTFK